MQTAVHLQLPQLQQGGCQWGGWATMAQQLKDDPGSSRLLVIGRFEELMRVALRPSRND
jgi:hypothetical protein